MGAVAAVYHRINDAFLFPPHHEHGHRLISFQSTSESNGVVVSALFRRVIAGESCCWLLVVQSATDGWGYDVVLAMDMIMLLTSFNRARPRRT